MQTCYRQRQSGYVLVTGLVFILIITVVTTSSMQSSNLDYKISSNEVFKNVAFQGSESGRIVAGENISHFVFYQEGATIAGLSYDSDYKGDIDKKEDGEDLLDTSTLNVDMRYDVSGSNVEPIAAEMISMKGTGAVSDRAGFQQLSGYEGLGKGAGNGGAQVIYEIRSIGYGGGSAVAVTATEYRVIP